MKKYNIIPGNDKLLINLEGRVKNIYSKDRLDELVKFDGENIILDMYGQERKVDKKWLTLICQYGFVMPCGFEEKIFEYRFREAYVGDSAFVAKTSKTRLPFEVVFENPVYYSAKFRIIPEFPEYAVSENKEFLDITTGKLLDILPVENKDFYPRVSLRHPFFHHKVNRLAHVLVCQTWHKNESFKQFPLVNHKDGNKNNYRADNLEWVSYSENLIHAYKSGLRTDNHPVKVYDKIKNTVTVYYSVTEAFKEMGLKPRANLEHYFRERNGLYTAKNRYEIRYLSDKNNFDLKTMSIEKAKEKSKALYSKRRLYQAIELESRREVVGGNGVIQRALGLSEAGVTGICRKRTIIDRPDKTRWIIRDYTDKPLDMSLYTEVSNKEVKIIRIEKSSGKETLYNSLREAGRENSKMDPKTIVNRIIDGKLHKGRFLFKYAENV